ncbi:DNA primase [Streptomyces bobili]|uniref:DNA primase n=1 Tax=Streptomyces bobili TaxID=67280 RepID=UPI00380C6AF8
MNRVGLGLAIGAGYVLGRTKKMKLALAVGSMVAGKKLNLTPRGVADLVSQQLKDNPQFKEISDQLRGELRGVGKAASGAMVERRMSALADRLHSRTGEVRDQLDGVVPDGDDRDADEADEYEEPESARDEDAEAEDDEAEEDAEAEADEDVEAEDDEAEEDAEAEADEDAEAEDDEEEPQRKKAAAKKTAPKKTAPKKTAKKAPAKKAPARGAAPRKKTAGSARKTAPKTASRDRRPKGGGE